jgi:antitoxin CcdA
MTVLQKINKHIRYAQIFMRIKIMSQTITSQAAPVSAAKSSGKRATNLTLSADVLDAAKQLKLNISQLCDAYLQTYVKQEQARRWREEHADFVAAYNETLAAEGLPLEEWKTF